MRAMPIALPLLLALIQAPETSAQTLVQIHDLSPREHEVATFVLSAPQALRIKAVGAEPSPDRFRERDAERWQNDAQTTWPAAAWILDARTRTVVWDLRAAETSRSSNGLRHFSGTVRLPAGVYEAHYASYPAAWEPMDGEVDLRRLARLSRRSGFDGPYVDDELYKEFMLGIEGSGRRATRGEIDTARRAFTASAIATVGAERNTSARQGFQLTRNTDVEIYAIGEITMDEPFDYGWIINADTHERVWTMAYANSEPAGGAEKNRMVNETIRLKPGRYAVYFVTDDSHSPDDWNAVPATDPEFWGVTLRVADAAARASVRPYNYEPVPAGQTIVSLIGIGDRATRSAGFTLRRPMTVRIYALGEGSENEMVDYAWIVDAARHKRVWTMDYDRTEDAGGADKNRLFDDTLRLEAGSYLVYYTSDGSHSYNDWNSAPPAEDRYWGVSVFPASGKLNPADVGPFERPSGGTVVARLNEIKSESRSSMPFILTVTSAIRIFAVGEGSGGEMFDYGWIEDERGRTVWRMQYDETDPAGGARKNRLFDGVITLPAGSYMLHYATDGSHAYGDWNDEPPDDPESWGITVFRMGDR
jgi:hypothetical protein